MQPSEEEDLLEQELTAVFGAGKDGCSPRGCHSVVDWCMRATGRLLLRAATGPEVSLTLWGTRMVRTLCLILLEDEGLWSPELGAWFRKTVTPCLFSQEDAAGLHDTMSYTLLHAVIERLQQQKQQG